MIKKLIDSQLPEHKKQCYLAELDKRKKQKLQSTKSDEYKKNLKRRATPAEKYIYALLKNIKKKHSIKGVYRFKYRFQKSFYDLKGNLFIVDFYFPTTKISLELDGGYHNTTKQQWRDYYKEKFIVEKRDGKVLRLTNEQALKMDESNFEKYLQENRILRT